MAKNDKSNNPLDWSIWHQYISAYNIEILKYLQKERRRKERRKDTKEGKEDA